MKAAKWFLLGGLTAVVIMAATGFAPASLSAQQDPGEVAIAMQYRIIKALGYPMLFGDICTREDGRVLSGWAY